MTHNVQGFAQADENYEFSGRGATTNLY